jgi:F0F1-type ATP synthase assembly protein I
MKKTDADSMTTPVSKLTEQSDDQSPSPSALKQLRIGQALLATTWRIVTPVVLGTGFGIFLDVRIGSKPWLTLLGVTLGFILAGVLIARLLKESENE